MNVYKNMSFALRQARMNKDEINRRVKNAAEILQISDFLLKTPRSLSGGQRQRVAIGRAIVREPDVFLFDEPLSNLDAALRVNTRLEIARLHKRLGTTMIYVTHDQVEAMTLADKIVVLNNGKIEQIGSPIELYENPLNMFVAGFIGSPKMNFLNSKTLTKNISTIVKGAKREDIIGIRPEHLLKTTYANSILSARLDLIENLGENVLVHMILNNDDQIIAKMNNAPKEPIGTKLHFTANIKNLHLFNKK